MNYKTAMKFSFQKWTILVVLFAALSNPLKSRSADSSGTHVIHLWNGMNTDGWQVFNTNGLPIEKFCTVSNGILALHGKPNGFLRTTRKYSNYNLHVVWRWSQDVPKNNSGIFIHVTGEDKIWPESIQCQVKVGQTGELLGMSPAKFDAPLVQGKMLVPCAKPNEKPVGQWNDYDIHCDGSRVQTTLNGLPEAGVGGCSVTNGFIGLQSEGYGIEFRVIDLFSKAE